MKYDEIIDCPKSGGDLCYKMEINENITNFFSFGIFTLSLPTSWGCVVCSTTSLFSSIIKYNN